MHRSPGFNGYFHLAVPHPTASQPGNLPGGDSIRARLTGAIAIFREVPGTFRLVWEADRSSAVAIAVLTLGAALLPAAIAYVGS